MWEIVLNFVAFLENLNFNTFKIVCKDQKFWEDHKNLKQSPTWLKRQIKWEIVLNFVAFLENLNFTIWTKFDWIC